MKSAIPHKRNRENRRMISHGHPTKKILQITEKIEAGTIATDPKEVIQASMVKAI